MSTITLTIGCPARETECPVSLPAAPYEIRQALDRLDSYAHDQGGEFELRAVRCDPPGIEQYVRMADINSWEDLRKVDHLARQIGEMSEEEKMKLGGALDTESVASLDDVLRIADGLGNYTLLPGVTTDRRLGEALVASGYKDFPDAVRPYLDYAAIGREYYAEHGGAYGPGGYVCRRENAPELAAKAPRDTVLTVSLLDANTGTAYKLELPASGESLEAARQALGTRDLERITIRGMEWADHEFESLEELDWPSVDILNRLAQAIRDSVTTPEEKHKLLAASEALETDSWEDLLEIANNLDDFELFRASDPNEYGRQLAEKMSEEKCDVLAELNDYIDFTQFGEDKMQANGVRETNYGYISRFSEPFPEENVFSQSFQ